MAARAFFDYPFPIAFAHRGGGEKYPENTLAAFEHAYKLGYRYFETDVHYTTGHELVAFHDDNLARTVGLTAAIQRMTRDDRRRHLVGGEHPIPLLSELLTLFPDVYFHIDAKSPAAVQPLVDIITAARANHRVALASFSARNSRQLRQLLPEVPVVASRSQILNLRYGFGRVNVSGRGKRYVSIPSHVFYNRGLVPFATASAIAKFHSRGTKVYVWTVNEEAEMRHLLDIGVDGLFTDKLTILKKVLQSRGQWL